MKAIAKAIRKSNKSWIPRLFAPGDEPPLDRGQGAPAADEGGEK